MSNKPKIKQVTIATTLPQVIYDKLKKSAKENDRSIAKESKRIITQHLEPPTESSKEEN